MAWTTPRCWTTGEVVTAALLNAQIKGNMDLTAPAKLTAAGDMLYATGANATARLGKGSNGNIMHQASCAPAWTACPSIAGITLSGALDANGTVDADVTDFDVLSSGDIDLVSSANAAAAVYIAQSTGTSGTIKIHADTGTSVTEGAESINILSDVGGVGIRSTANLANAINITSDGGTTGTISIFNDQGSSVTEGAESISLLSDAGGVGIRSTANLANAVNITADGGTTSTIQIFNDQGTAVNEGVASIQLLSDVGGIGIKSGLNAAGAIRLTADAGTSETIVLHADQGSGTGSICLTSDAGGITLNPATFLTVGGNAANAGEIRIMEDSDAGCHYAAIKVQNMAASYTLTLPADDGCCGEVLTTNGSGTLTWGAAGGISGLGGTDNAILRANGTGGATAQGSAVLITDAGLIQVADGCASTPSFAFKCNSDTGFFSISHDKIGIAAGGNEHIRLDLAGGGKRFGLNDCDPGNGTVLLMSNGGANDDDHFALNNSDVGHDMTGYAHADTFFSVRKAYSNSGGVHMYGFKDDHADGNGHAFVIQGLTQKSPIQTNSASGYGVIVMRASESNGSGGAQAAHTCDNIFSVDNHTCVRFIIKGGGSVMSTDSDLGGGLDDFCDSMLIRDVELIRTERACYAGIIKSQYDDWQRNHYDKLVEAGLYTEPPWEGGLLNTTQWRRLANGAIWQLYTKIKDQSEEILGLQQDLKALKGV